MKYILIISCVLLTVIFPSCDVRSEIAKKDMEKFVSTPTPASTPQPTATPVDPADVVEVDVNQDGELILAAGHNQKKTVACSKFNRVMINGDESIITIKGVCRQVMINGDRNKLTAVAAMEFVLNGTGNRISYSRFANGKLPSVIENRPGNVIEKVSTGR